MKRTRLGILTALALVSISIFVAPIFAQSPSPAGGEGVRAKSLLQQIKEGGWVMFPIALCSIATLYLIGDGIIRTSQTKVAPPEHEENVKTLFRNGDYVGAYKYCKENPSPLSNVLRA